MANELFDRWIVPPFSVLDTRAAYWQDRKRRWLDWGISSHEGRDAPTWSVDMMKEVTYHTDGTKEMQETDTRTSIFDPVLAEVLYTWFAKQDGSVLDPFAGGSVRGMVAAALGLQYTGVDLSQRQIDANMEQVNANNLQGVQYICDDASNLDAHTLPRHQFMLSCPPYHDLEVYSDDARDLSNMDWHGFRMAYRNIIAQACQRMALNTFAVFVVTEIRGGKQAAYRGLVPETIQAFTDAGMLFYNEIILVNAVGSLRLRVGNQFTCSRKIGRTHQNVLVFCKGDPNITANQCGLTVDSPAAAPVTDEGPSLFDALGMEA